MLARTYTATMMGLEPIKIEVEVDSNRGTPGLIIIGLPTKAVEESKERITASLSNCGIRIRSRRTVVNLAPADLRKSSSGFDLAIAVSLLKMYGEVQNLTDDTMFFGELSLDGTLKPIKSALPLVLAARSMDFKKVIIPEKNAAEVATVSGIDIFSLNHLHEFISFARGEIPLRHVKTKPFVPEIPSFFSVDFQDIVGQFQAKRALEIAAAGGHNLLLTGPPGAGKSLLAKSLVSILPPLTESEALEVTNIYSIYGISHHGLMTTRPFRAPHHTTSPGGLIGGGQQLKPGEISLAHRGILFLDEAPEFNREALEALRQPLEDGIVTLSRANGRVTYPASFSLITAANPCPCGYAGSRHKPCTCNATQVHMYNKRLSGPILDRIDLKLFVTEVERDHLAPIHTSVSTTESSERVRERVLKAHQRQQHRYQHTQVRSNAELASKNILDLIQLHSEARRYLNQALSKHQLSARSFFNVLKVAQTIADLEEEPVVATYHLGEALLYRE